MTIEAYGEAEMGGEPYHRNGGGACKATDQVSIYLADGQALARRGLRDLLLTNSRYVPVGETGDGLEMMTAVELLQPAVLLIDLALPGIESVSAIATLRSRQPDLRILVLSAEEPAARALEALEAGALGYLPKSSSEQEALSALQYVSNGRPWIPDTLTLQMIEQRRQNAPGLASLTRREIEILRLIARGLSNQEIAEQAHISEGTVRTHLTNIFGKLEIGNRVEATLCALRDGLATLDECLG
jgi:DNA-binding NarL/FixJ family response regulator